MESSPSIPMQIWNKKKRRNVHAFMLCPGSSVGMRTSGKRAVLSLPSLEEVNSEDEQGDRILP